MSEAFLMKFQDMSDETLIGLRDYYNAHLEEMFYRSSGTYDNGATLVKEIEKLLNEREHDGPPWLAD